MGNQQPGGGGGGNAGGGGGGDPHHQHSSNRNDHHHHQQQHQQQQQQQQQYGGYQPQQQQQQQYQQQHHTTIPSANPNQVAPPGSGGGYGGGGYNQQQQVLLNIGGVADPYGNNPSSSINRSSSDASMTIMDNNALVGLLENSNNNNNNNTTNNDPQSSSTNNNNTNNPAIPPIALENWLDDDTVPTVFRWEHGGRQVYITGTFNGWSRQIPMHRSGNDFSYIHNLKRGKHAFKFIVDDEWRFAPDQPTVADIEGRINNFIDVTSFIPYTGDKDFEKEKAAAEYGVNLSASTGIALGSIDDPTGGGGAGSGGGGGDSSLEGNSDGPSTLGGVASSALAAMGGGGTVSSSSGPKPDRDGEIFNTTMPDMDEYTKEPPPLPPHLRHIILNKPPQLSDTAALPVPQHVALNHLYCTAIKDNMMVLGITQRYKTKFVTTVYYSPCGK